LAVAQAGAFIHCHSSLSQYQELYQRERDNLLQNEETQGQDPYELAVYSTWRLSYDKLDPSARLFLHIYSLLHHEGISEETFEKAALSQVILDNSELQDEVANLLGQLGKQDTGWSSWTFRKVIMQLGSHSLIEYDHQNRIYSIHPLIHHWSATTLEGNRSLMQNLVLTMIALSFSLTFTEDDFMYRRKLLKHTTNLITSLKPEDIDSLAVLHIAQIYSDAVRLKETEALQVMAMEKRKRMLGDDHPDTLISMEEVAGTYWGLGRWSDAEALLLVVLGKRRLVLGDDHPDTLRGMEHLADTYREQGRWSDAEPLYFVVMEKRKLVLGDDHPDTFETMTNLANMYRYQGRLSNAEALEVVVMEKTKRVLGDDHPDTIMSMSNLANTYSYQGRWKEADTLQLVVLEKSKQVLGDDHPNTLTAIGNLAHTYREEGRLDDAEPLFVMVTEKRKQCSAMTILIL